MTDNTEATGTAGAGTSWSHPLATTTEDGARIVYVAVPNEDSLAIAEGIWRRKDDQEPRVNAINAVIASRGVRYGEGKESVEDLLRDAAKVEEYIRSGKVPKAGRRKQTQQQDA